MQLNHDCIRDVLLCIEKNIESINSRIPMDALAEVLNQYDYDVVEYHVQQLYDGGIIGHILTHDYGITYVFDLSWEGHQYLATIRDSKTWSSIKTLTKGMGSLSLSMISTIGTEVLKKQLGL